MPSTCSFNYDMCSILHCEMHQQTSHIKYSKHIVFSPGKYFTRFILQQQQLNPIILGHISKYASRKLSRVVLTCRSDANIAPYKE